MYEAFVNPPFRYLGYGFAFYQAMKSVLRTKPEKTFYLVATVFIFAHSMDVALDKFGAMNMLVAFIDTLIFEVIASVAIPICVAKAAFDMSSHLLIDLNIHFRVTRYGPPFLTLLSILLISQPLDTFTRRLMTKTVRQLYPYGTI